MSSDLLRAKSGRSNFTTKNSSWSWYDTEMVPSFSNFRAVAEPQMIAATTFRRTYGYLVIWGWCEVWKAEDAEGKGAFFRPGTAKEFKPPCHICLGYLV
jgi:hypothetical protein